MKITIERKEVKLSAEGHLAVVSDQGKATILTVPLQITDPAAARLHARFMDRVAHEMARNRDAYRTRGHSSVA